MMRRPVTCQILLTRSTRDSLSVTRAYSASFVMAKLRSGLSCVSRSISFPVRMSMMPSSSLPSQRTNARESSSGSRISATGAVSESMELMRPMAEPRLHTSTALDPPV
ncbi:hypothetical protein NP493_23g01042 [Ridgeia piscesae]|uniref:Uncharacterized protein n=1 Tax=Ridgeia piscesae TaxID=27915 RepID=A0AAD9UKD0_RIDPI|nr:hypothetical protein NP493_23g01042 [Ridgeia piscesae]